MSGCELEQRNLHIKVLENHLNSLKSQLSLVQTEKNHLDELNKKDSAQDCNNECPEPEAGAQETAGDREHPDLAVEVIQARLVKHRKKVLELENQIRLVMLL